VGGSKEWKRKIKEWVGPKPGPGVFPDEMEEEGVVQDEDGKTADFGDEVGDDAAPPCFRTSRMGVADGVPVYYCRPEPPAPRIANSNPPSLKVLSLRHHHPLTSSWPYPNP